MLQALREVEDARANLVSSDAATQRLASALSASNHALRLANQLYKGGATDFLDVLSAQGGVFARRRGAQSGAGGMRSPRSRCRSLGGGWSRNDAAGGTEPEAVAATAAAR
jgi:outer membrane protein TolC